MDLTNSVIKKPKVFRGAVISPYANSKNSVGDEMTAQLKPFRYVMRKQLEKRGYNTKAMPFKNVIPLYYNEFVSNVNLKGSPFVPINTFEFSNNPIFKFGGKDNLNGDIFTHKNRDYFVQVGSIVDNIVSVFKTAKAKKRYANLNHLEIKEVLTDEEIVQAKAAERVEKDLESKLQGNKPVTVKSIRTLIFIGLVIWLLYYMSK